MTHAIGLCKTRAEELTVRNSNQLMVEKSFGWLQSCKETRREAQQKKAPPLDGALFVGASPLGGDDQGGPQSVYPNSNIKHPKLRVKARNAPLSAKRVSDDRGDKSDGSTKMAAPNWKSSAATRRAGRRYGMPYGSTGISWKCNTSCIGRKAGREVLITAVAAVQEWRPVDRKRQPIPKSWPAECGPLLLRPFAGLALLPLDSDVYPALRDCRSFPRTPRYMVFYLSIIAAIHETRDTPGDPSSLLQGLRPAAGYRVLDLEPRLRCRECDPRGNNPFP
jgi:hypothetical protein